MSCPVWVRQYSVAEAVELLESYTTEDELAQIAGRIEEKYDEGYTDNTPDDVPLSRYWDVLSDECKADLIDAKSNVWDGG